MESVGRPEGRRLFPRWAPALVVALLLLFYTPTLANLVAAYVAPGSFYSHGFLVPFACLFLYYEKRDRLSRVPRLSSRWGIPVIVLGCALHLLGLRGSASFISGLSIPVVLLGLTLYHFGSGYTREALPLIGLLLFMIPFPQWVLYQATFHMKMAAAALGSSIVKVFGLPVVREGIYIDLPNGISFAIEDPCSGLRSIVSLAGIAYILAVLAPVALARKWLIFLSSVPLAWAGNLVRVAATILLVHFAGHSAASPLPHMLTGFTTFLLSLFLLIVWSNSLLWRGKREASG